MTRGYAHCRYLEEMNLYLAGDYTYSHYVESTVSRYAVTWTEVNCWQDTAFYMCGDRINDIWGLRLPSTLSSSDPDT